MRRTFFLLLITVLLGAFLRFYELGNNPPSLTWDEVAWGYNAYTLGIDGRDEFGRFLPLDYTESFGDFKPVLYAYITILPVKLWGLTEFAVRFPSALFGTLTVLMAYFLVYELFKKWEIALLTSFLLAISPWHINLSRAAFEANVATFFLVCAVWLFFRWAKDGRWYNLTLSAVAFALSVYTFNTTRIVSLLLLLVLTIGFMPRILARKKDVAVAILVGIFFLMPILPFLFSPQARLRFEEVNIFSDIGIIHRTNQEMLNDDNAWWSRILHNRRLAYTVEYLRHYFDHFHPSFLFIRGDGNPKFSTQDVGQLYLWDLPFFIIGILFLFRLRPKYWWLIFLWLLLGIAPAATARETPHALRIEATLPTFQIIVAYGFYQSVLGIKNYVSSINMRNFLLFTFYFLLFFNVLYYLHGYYFHFPREYSGEWQYGYKEAVAFVQKVQDGYDSIYMTTELGRPHIYYAFYLKLDPKVYRADAIVRREEPFGFVHVDRLGKYHFAKEFKVKERNGETSVLFISAATKVPDYAKVIKIFHLLNGKPALVAYTL